MQDVPALSPSASWPISPFDRPVSPLGEPACPRLRDQGCGMGSRVRGNRHGAGAGQSQKSGPAPPGGGGDPVEAEAREHPPQRLDQPKITQCRRDRLSAAGARPGERRWAAGRSARGGGARSSRGRQDPPGAAQQQVFNVGWVAPLLPTQRGDGSGVVPAFPCRL